jgi:hypothetical protein
MKKKYNYSFFNLKLFLLIFFVYANSYGLTIYVNDAFTADDIYTTAAGNNANNGLTPATPKATLAGALAIATNGDIIYIDYGNYNDVGLNINVEVEIIGAGEEMTVFRRTSGVNRWGLITANNVKVSKLTITEYNLASDGIAVAITSGSGIEFNRVTIYANVGSAGQGAVWITGATTSATFKNSGSPCNRVGAANYGGAFKIEGATAVIDNCSINNNIISALYGGGVLVAGNNSNVTIINTTFDDNEASSGGALAVTGSNATVNVSGSCFNNNRATIATSNEGGGAVFLRPSTNSSTSTINFSNCSFNGNTSIGASSDGGAVCITNLNSPNINVNFTTCSFSGNSTNDDGDDIYFRKGNSALYNITFRNNTFFDVFAGSKVNLYNNNLLASEIKFEGLTTPTGTSANGDIVASPSGIAIDQPEMFGNYTETSSSLPTTLPVTRCIDRFDGVCGTASATITCVTENRWNGTSWSRGIPTIFQHVILTANYNTEIHGNIDACQMTVNSGVTLDILDGTDGTYVYVVNSIFNNGTINVTSKANLVQVNHPLDLNDEAIVTPNINFSKNTGDKIRWDYVYWGKPIADNVLSAYNANFDIKYYWDPDFAGIGQSYLGWRVLNSEPSIGMGFITRVKTAIGMTPTNINLSYSGVSNNGDYNATVKYYDADNYSFRNFTLLGNPYPGAIDFEKFYLDNSDKIYGTVYLWSSYTPYPGSGLYQQADYASFNLTGGVGVPGTSNTQSPNGILPNGYIASAQGFMVRPKVNGQVVFNNSQRTKDIPSNNQFFRTQNQQKDRFWLRLTDSNGRFSDLLIGYIDKATNGFDEAYDGLLNSLSTLKFFSQLDEKRLVIQGRGNFDIEDKVMIDYAISNQESTMLTISLSKKEGIFNDQKIYLHDKKLNFYHDLTIADYIFHTDDTQNRFEVLYEIIKPEEILDNNDINVFATINNNELIVKSNSVLSNVELYDINGRLVFKEDFNQDLMQFNKNVFLPNGIYIAIVKTKSGFQKSIKISN